MLKVLKDKFLSLGRDEDGAALVVTLAIFFLMYLGCMGVYAVSMSVKERVQLQNAVDAAAYSAAVVQADTLSRIATINRAMSWTYVDMTRHQMDYIVRRWLGHTCDHYEEDLNGGRDEKNKKHDGLEDYTNHSILLKGPCAFHKSFCGGWYIGADGNVSPPPPLSTVHLNGVTPGLHRMPKGSGKEKLPTSSSGHTTIESLVRARNLDFDAEYLLKYRAWELIGQVPLLASEQWEISKLTLDVLGNLKPSIQTVGVLRDNLAQTYKVLQNWDADGV